jgi:hypothetical protein
MGFRELIVTNRRGLTRDPVKHLRPQLSDQSRVSARKYQERLQSIEDRGDASRIGLRWLWLHVIEH